MDRPTLEELDRDIKSGFAKRDSRLERFLEEWVKYRDNGQRLLRARGQKGETLLHARLAERDVVGAHALFTAIRSAWSKDNPAWLFDFLNQDDEAGNGVWHYLAGAIQSSEGYETLTLARELVALDVDFARANHSGLSPLGRMILPKPRWKSINALIECECLTMENVERAVAEYSHNESERATIIAHILSEDAANNRSILCGTIVRQALHPKAEKPLRVKTAAQIFDYVDLRDGSVPFFSLVAYADTFTFDGIIRLLSQQVEEAVLAMTPPDVTSKKAYRQALLCRRLLRRDNNGEGMLFKALKVGNTMHLRKLIGLLINDDLHVSKLIRGEYSRHQVTLEKDSPAPSNPLLSLLLQQGEAGNTVFHEAALRGERDVLSSCLFSLGSNDVYAILTAVPNAAGLTLRDMTRFELARSKIQRAVRLNAISEALGQDLIAKVGKMAHSVTEVIQTRISEIEALAADTKGGTPVAPTFEIGRMMPPQAALMAGI